MYELADAWNILLIFIRRGRTGKYQPFDRFVFDPPKGKECVGWSTFDVENPGRVCMREQAVGLLLERSAKVPEFCIQARWDLDAKGDHQTSSDEDYDGKWELTMEPYPDDGEETSDHGEKKPDADDFELIEHAEAR
jgi:hypothetical protein